METSAFLVSTLILEALLILRLIMLAYTQRLFPQRCYEKLQKLWQDLRQSWWTEEDATEKAVDQTRCQLTRLLWTAVCTISFLRLLSQQLLLVSGRNPIRPEFDLQLICLMSVSLVINFRPQLITPNSLDLWYVATSLMSIATLLPAAHINVMVYMAYSFKSEIFFAALTKRSWCYVLCTCFHMLYTIRLAREDQNVLDQGGPAGVVVLYILLFVGIAAARRCFLYNTKLKLHVQRQTVELGAVSSLLLVCYDAVLEVDDTLCLTAESPQLSSLLLRSQRRWCGKSFLECFDDEDQDRLRTQIAGSISDGKSSAVMALHVDMLDADQNRVKVELLHARFQNLSNERRFLIGIREIQDCYVDSLAPLPNDTFTFTTTPRDVGSPRAAPLDGASNTVVFEVPSFEILSIGQDVQQLCQDRFLRPENILDLSCDQSRFAFCDQLQHIVNSQAVELASEVSPVSHQVSFNLLGLHSVTAMVQLEFDHLLDTMVASLQLQALQGPGIEGVALTEANLRKLNDQRRLRRPSTSSSRRSSSRRSLSSRRSSLRSSRGSSQPRSKTLAL